MATKIYLDINKSCVFDTDGVVETIPTGSLIMRKHSGVTESLPYWEAE